MPGSSDLSALRRAAQPYCISNLATALGALCGVQPLDDSSACLICSHQSMLTARSSKRMRVRDAHPRLARARAFISYSHPSRHCMPNNCSIEREDTMSIEERHFSRQDLLDALEQGWKQYLPRLAALSEDEQARYAQEQGYARVQDVLVHIFSWWERSIRRSRRLVSGTR